MFSIRFFSGCEHFLFRARGAETKLIFKRRKPDSFVTSNRSETERAKHMSTWSVVKIRGGPVLIVACAFYLFIALSNLNFI